MLIPFKTLIEKYKITPTGILHVGAHWGEEAKDYADAGVENVIWIEAMPDAYKILGGVISKYPKNKRLLACVGDTDGKEVTFNIANNEGQSSSYLELGTHKTVHPEVRYVSQLSLKTYRIDTLLNGNSVDVADYDFLNMDLQGAELLALKGMGELLHKVKYAYLEVNKAELYVGCPLIEDIDEYMKGYGFKRVETAWAGNTNWGDAFYIKQ